MRSFLFFCFALFMGWSAQAEAPHPPLEAYGELPRVRHMSLSPDGEMVAFVYRQNGADVIATLDIATKAITPRLSVDNIATRNIWFADAKHLILSVSDTKDLSSSTARMTPWFR